LQGNYVQLSYAQNLRMCRLFQALFR